MPIRGSVSAAPTATRRGCVPENRDFVNVEEVLASVRQDSAPAERKTKRLYERRRQGQVAVEARINKRFDLLLSLRATHRQANNGLAVGVHNTGYHAVVGG